MRSSLLLLALTIFLVQSAYGGSKGSGGERHYKLNKPRGRSNVGVARFTSAIINKLMIKGQQRSTAVKPSPTTITITPTTTPITITTPTAIIPTTTEMPTTPTTTAKTSRFSTVAVNETMPTSTAISLQPMPPVTTLLLIIPLALIAGPLLTKPVTPSESARIHATKPASSFSFPTANPPGHPTLLAPSAVVFPPAAFIPLRSPNGAVTNNNKLLQDNEHDDDKDNDDDDELYADDKEQKNPAKFYRTLDDKYNLISNDNKINSLGEIDFAARLMSFRRRQQANRCRSRRRIQRINLNRYIKCMRRIKRHQYRLRKAHRRRQRRKKRRRDKQRRRRTLALRRRCRKTTYWRSLRQ